MFNLRNPSSIWVLPQTPSLPGGHGPPRAHETKIFFPPPIRARVLSSLHQRGDGWPAPESHAPRNLIINGLEILRGFNFHNSNEDIRLCAGHFPESGQVIKNKWITVLHIYVHFYNFQDFKKILIKTVFKIVK